ncbi:MAG: hypothetical protein AMS18_09530 [Gemmatimonas sp. SG8_17]|nr:MAG: hypothetical protein AMS18_09530 [Gemmatimonas sp. SG8_17]
MSEDALESRPNEEQLLYAKILEIGMFVGLGLLLVTFFLYVSGIVGPAVPVEELPKYWEMSVHDYLEATNHDYVHSEHVITGWSWLAVLGKGDYLNFLGIALLSGVTVVCYLGIVPILIKKRDLVFAAIALVEVVILTLAASGILSVGH